MNHLPFSLHAVNEQSVTNFAATLDVLSSLKIALVVQGGGQRGIYSAGVLDSFLAAEFDPFELYIGTSAGALNLSSFISRQYRFGYHFIHDYTTDDRFFSLYNYLSKQQPIDLDWALHVVSPSGSLPLDFITAKNTLQYRQAFACATRKDTLKDIYLPLYQQNWQEVFRASCAVPLLYNLPVNLNDLEWVDGGVSAAIPVKEAWRRGANLVVVIRTEPLEYDHHDESGIFDDWRESIEAYFPYYIDKLSLNNSVDKLKNIHQELSQRFEQWREQSGTNKENKKAKISSLRLDEEKSAVIGKKNWLSHLSIERILQLAGQSKNNEILDMLNRYYQTYRDVNNFLIDPPPELYVIQIAPEKTLNSRALLSSSEDLDTDYQDGLVIGRQFVQTFSDLLNRKTSLMEYMRD